MTNESMYNEFEPSFHGNHINENHIKGEIISNMENSACEV